MGNFSLAGAALALAAMLACGGGGHGDITAPLPPDPSDPSEPPPSGPAPAEAPAPVGWSIYAVDLTNHFLLFGSESPEVLSRKLPITGLPILKRIIGIAFRPKDGKLYGVGNDSRVYVIDTLTAVATPVGSGTFSPKIAEFFDIHFAMALESAGDRVRLFAAESGGNWSISLDDGTATMGARAHYADSTELAGRTPALMGILYAPQDAGASVRVGSSRVSLAAAPASCEDLMYAIDADQAMILSMCDPDTGEWAPVGDLPKEDYARCGEMFFTPSPDGGPGDGPGGQPGSDLPEGPLAWGYELQVLMMRKLHGTEAFLNNYLGRINPDGSFSWAGQVDAAPIQTADTDFKVGGKYGPRRSPLNPKVMATRRYASTAAVAGDPPVQCTRPS